MNFRQLRCLVACAEQRDIVSAAVRLSLSPSVVGRQLKSLEDELGVELIYLRARPLAFTLRGEHLVREARKVLGMVTDGVESVRRSQNRIVGTIRLALSLSAGHRLVYEIIKDFAGIAPEVKLDIRDVAFPSQLPQIQRGELDIALLFPAWTSPGVCSETLVHEQVTIVMPKGHRFRRRTELRLAELSSERWLVFYKPNSGRLGVDFYRACENAGFTPLIAAEIQSQLVRMAHVAKGDGITILSKSYDAGVRRDLVRVPLHRDDLNMPAAIMWREHDDRQSVQLFLESARRTVQRIYLRDHEPPEQEFGMFFLPPQPSSISLRSAPVLAEAGM